MDYLIGIEKADQYMDKAYEAANYMQIQAQYSLAMESCASALGTEVDEEVEIATEGAKDILANIKAAANAVWNFIKQIPYFIQSRLTVLLAKIKEKSKSTKTVKVRGVAWNAMTKNVETMQTALVNAAKNLVAAANANKDIEEHTKKFDEYVKEYFNPEATTGQNDPTDLVEIKLVDGYKIISKFSSVAKTVSQTLGTEVKQDMNALNTDNTTPEEVNQIRKKLAAVKKAGDKSLKVVYKGIMTLNTLLKLGKDKKQQNGGMLPNDTNKGKDKGSSKDSGENAA